MNEEELKQSLMNCCVAVNDSLDELIRKLQALYETYIEPKLNEYFEDQDRRRMERRKELEE